MHRHRDAYLTGTTARADDFGVSSDTSAPLPEGLPSWPHRAYDGIDDRLIFLQVRAPPGLSHCSHSQPHYKPHCSPTHPHQLPTGHLLLSPAPRTYIPLSSHYHSSHILRPLHSPCGTQPDAQLYDVLLESARTGS